jgi:hypothetical protein
MNETRSRRSRVACIALLAAALGACTSLSFSATHPAGDARAQAGDWFVKTGCTTCHSITVYGIWTLAATAPDLSIAVEDVPRRFGRSLEDFLQSPTGTMSMVLSSQIRLTEQERAMAVVQLKEAYRRHQEKSVAGGPVPSH